jgi:hypothetical protein
MQIALITVMLNFFVDLSSSLIPALLCGIILIYVFQKRALFFSIGSSAIFLALSSMLGRFWKAPDIGMQISALMGPILSVLVLVSSIWLLLKSKNRITTPSTQTRN